MISMECSSSHRFLTLESFPDVNQLRTHAQAARIA